MKTRTVILLGSVGAAVLGIGLSLGLRNTGVMRQEMEVGRLALPGLAPRLQAATRVEVVRGDRILVVEKSGDRWGLPERGGYPVQADKLRGILTGLTELRLLDPRTSDPGQYSRLGLEDPKTPVGTSILLRVLDAGGHPITEIILGHRRVRTQGNLPEQIYVRFPGQEQAWLGEGRLAVDADPQLWLDRDVADIPNARIASAVVERGAERLELARQDGKPALVAPAEHRPLEEYRVEDVFRAFETLTFTDVQPVAKMPGEPVGTARFTTTEGTQIAVQGYRSGEQFWVRLAANGADSSALQARWSGWAFQLGQWKEKSLLPRLDDLTVAPPPPPPPPMPDPTPTPGTSDTPPADAPPPDPAPQGREPTPAPETPAPPTAPQ